MVLMLADHFYSAAPEVTNEWRASDYLADQIGKAGDFNKSAVRG